MRARWACCGRGEVWAGGLLRPEVTDGGDETPGGDDTEPSLGVGVVRSFADALEDGETADTEECRETVRARAREF